MGAGIDLSIAERMAIASTEISKFNMGSASWTKPVIAISTHYGTNPGQVPIHHKPSDSTNLTVDVDGLILASTNLGGAGGAFDLSGSVERAPTYSGGSFQFNNVIDKSMVFALNAQHAGVHSITAIKIGALAANYLAIFSHENLWQRIYVRTSSNPPRFAVMNSAKAIPIQGIVNYGNDEWIIAELRMDAAGTAAIINGTIIAQNTTIVSDYSISYLGYGGTQGQVTIGAVGDFASVICESGHSAASPEQAILDARREISGIYGVTMA